MAAEDFKRKLTAVMSADVAGYSRLMAEDEAATVKTIAVYREVMASLIKQHRGRVVDSPGDNVLAEFASVVDAVQCSVSVQKELQARNAELLENRRMEFRIGINLGDVIEEEDRLYGDGVNIAARLEALADPGGICVSKTAFDHIESKLPLGYEYLGEQEVKNIPKPVGAYRVLMEPRVTVAEQIEKVKTVPLWQRKTILAGGVVLVLVVIAALIWNFYFRPPPIELASVEKMAYPLPEEPSIAVLPFTNMSGDPEQEYFTDGITEQIITGLSKTPKLFVIARNSTFTYKGKAVKVQQVAEEMGVRYVLEGSVQKSGERIRISAQLIDALTGRHLWSERYDLRLKDIFAVQDQITMSIITALRVKLTDGELARPLEKGTNNLEAYTKYLQAREHLRRRTKDDNATARRIVMEAIALDPEYPPLYTLLGLTHLTDILLRLSENPKQSLAQAIELTQKSISMDDSLHHSHAVLGWLYTMERRFDKGIAECERAVALSPNAADAYFHLGNALRFAGRHEESVRATEKAVRLNPFPRPLVLSSLGSAYFFTGRYGKAIEMCEKAVKEAPDDLIAHLHLAAAYVGAGREEEAQAQIGEVLRINPKYSLEYQAKMLPFKNKRDLDRVIGALRKAGLPESPTLPLPDKPSIAVLPFVNMSDDPKQEYFSDGITEEIITALSKTPKLFVIARNSTFTYKGKPVKVQQVGRELGVKYVLEGSVRKAADKVRITAQLVDAQTSHHLWAERYDRDLKDIFAVQDEITKKIITAMHVKLTEGEQVRAAAKGTKNLEAYLKYLRASEYIQKFNKESNALGKQLAEEAIALDPEYASAYMILGKAHMLDVWIGSSKSSKDSIAKAIELEQKAIALDDSYAEAHGLLGFLFSMTRQHDKAIAKAEMAVALNPSSAESHYRLGKILNFASRWEESIPEYEKAIRLNPIPPNQYLFSLGLAYGWTGQYDKAITWCEKATRQLPDSLLARIFMTVVYSYSGREEEARVEAAEILRIQPKFSLKKWEKKVAYKNPEDKERLMNALRKAGLPE